MEPEMVFYFSRHLARIDKGDEAPEMIVRAGEDGFLCAPQTLRNDPWLESVRALGGFADLLRRSEIQMETTRRACLSQAWFSKLASH
jgi:hypothetical protein